MTLNFGSLLAGTETATSTEEMLEPESGVASTTPTEVYEVLPHEGSIDGIYHVHSTFSDGKDPFLYMLKEATMLELDYLGMADHLDLTSISEKEHQTTSPIGPFNENFEERKLGLSITVEDNEVTDEFPPGRFNEMALGLGAEVDWDPRRGKAEVLERKLRGLDFDYYLLSVHHDEEGGRFGSTSDFESLTEREKREKVEDYFQYNRDAIDLADSLPRSKVLSHPARIEKSLPDYVYQEDYHDLLDYARGKDVAYEVNGKVQLRHLLSEGELTKGAQALIEHERLPDISAGTDTHRVGKSEKVNYNFTESQARLDFLEDIFAAAAVSRGEAIEPVSILDQVEGLPDFRTRIPEDSKLIK
jgi:histidinol phosphatase-like PHP family hydrolase